MSNAIITTSASNRLAAQPVSSVVILRSTSDSDTMSSETYGTISGVPGYSAKSLTGKVETQTADVFTAITQSLLASAPVGTITALKEGTAGVGDIRVDVIPLDGATLTVGLFGHTQSYRWKNTLASAYDVKIAGTLAGCASNFKAALNADGTPGTEYYAGTLANPYLSATVDTAVVTTTDRIKCARQLAWVFTESASNFSKRVPTGGVDGTTLFSFAAGVSSAADPLTFSTEDHSTTTLPALMLGTSPGISIGGKQCMLRLWSDQTFDYHVESSTDLLNWNVTSEGNLTLAPSTLTNVILAELHEYIRFVIIANGNTTASKFDGRVIF